MHYFTTEELDQDSGIWDLILTSSTPRLSIGNSSALLTSWRIGSSGESAYT